MKVLIKNAQIVNEGQIISGDVLIEGQRIARVDRDISDPNAKVIDADGRYLLPGVIDDQVHFRDPGLTHKADIHSESIAAVAGGVTSFMDMPNTSPAVLTQEILEEKYRIAAQKSVANYSFMMGINKDNLEEVLKTNPETVPGVTDDGLYFSDEEGIMANYPDFLEKLFSRVETLVALHSEDDAIIAANTARYREQFGDDIPFDHHPKIRSEEACVVATKRVLEIARKHQTRFHLYHVSTAAEAQMLDNNVPLRQKRITGEACVHHLWFSDEDYATKGARIKWNPAVKSAADRDGLLQAVLEGKLDIIATDHAPHTVDEKSGNYFHAKSGGPLVQHALPAMLELYHREKITLPQIAEKMAHNVAEIYRMKDRGYIREGYYADLVLVDLDQPWTVAKENVRYKCGWSPFEGTTFQSRITHTMVNGTVVYENDHVNANVRGMRLLFQKER